MNHAHSLPRHDYDEKHSYNIASAYGRMHDRDNERLWLQKIKDSDWPRTKANRNIFEYADYRLDKLKEDEFFEGK